MEYLNPPQALELPSVDVRPFQRRGLFQNWQIKILDAEKRQGLLLRLNHLQSENRFRKAVQVFALAYSFGDDDKMQRTLLREDLVLDRDHQLHFYGDDHIQVGNCLLSPQRIRGKIQHRGQFLKWDFEVAWSNRAHYNLYPQALQQLGLVKPQTRTLNGNLILNGETITSAGTRDWKSAQATLGHTNGPFQFHSWSWAHCDHFFNQKGDKVSFTFEGLCFRSRLVGPVTLPEVSSFFIQYKDEVFLFNTVRSWLRVDTKQEASSWEVIADRGEYQFRIKLHTPSERQIGSIQEDTDGSYIYCASSLFSEMEILIFRNGKLEERLTSDAASHENATRQKSPYVGYPV